jgi:hypothetical protein
MERLHIGYRDIMEMPVGRRKRFCEEIEHVDRVRAKRREAKQNRPTAGRKFGRR